MDRLERLKNIFEMVGIPTEDRVKIVVLYVVGKAVFWWRGT